jgi:hypothetical protein
VGKQIFLVTVVAVVLCHIEKKLLFVCQDHHQK